MHYVLARLVCCGLCGGWRLGASDNMRSWVRICVVASEQVD